MKTFTYTPVGTCSRAIEIDIDADGLIADIRFLGGCHGNLQGMSALARGMRPAEVAEKIRGIRCGHKATSCPDQLAQALAALESLPQ